MIQKRYKQTEALTQAQELKTIIEAQEVILAKIDTECDVTINGNTYTQFLVVKNINVVVTENYIKLYPERVLINQVTDKILNLTLPVPDWTIYKDNESSHVGEDGERIMYEMEWYDDETDEAVTEQTYTAEVLDSEGLPTKDEEGNIIYEEITEPLTPLEPEAFMMPSIPYIMFFAKNMVLPELITSFSHQFIADNFDYWNSLAEDLQQKPL